MESIQENDFVEPSLSENIKKNFATPELVFEWRKWYLKEGHSVHSATTYFNYLKLFTGYGIEINQKSVNSFTNKSPSSVAIASLKNFFGFLVKKKEFPQDILLINFDKHKTNKKFPKSIDPSDVQKIIDAIPEEKEKYLTMVIYDLGLRISEGLKLQWSDINWTKWLQKTNEDSDINLTDTKGGKFRTIPLSNKITKIIYDAHKNRNLYDVPLPNPNVKNSLIFDFGIDDYLANKDKSPDENKYDYINYAGYRYRKLLDKIGLEVLGRKINPHIFRHTKAQDMMNHHVPIESIKRFLGHSNISSTEIYAQASAEKLKEDLKKYHESH